MTTRLEVHFSDQWVDIKNSALLETKNLPSNAIRMKHLSPTSSTHIHNLDIESFGRVCDFLDLPSQISLYKSSKILADKILVGKWYGYRRNGFNMLSIDTLPEDAQLECFVFIISLFSIFKNVPFEIFRRYITATESNLETHIKSLDIRCKSIRKRDKILKFKDFLRFPNLQELKLINFYIDFSDKNCILPLKFLYLEDVIVLEGMKEVFLKKECYKDLQKLTFLSNDLLMYIGVVLKEFPKFLDFNELKEITLNTNYLYDPDALKAFLRLDTLEIITLRNHEIFGNIPTENYIISSIIKKYDLCDKSYLKELIIIGVPGSLFFEYKRLKEVASIIWSVRKTYHLGSDGSLVWKANIGKIIDAFKEMLEQNTNLEHVSVEENIYFEGNQMDCLKEFVASCNNKRENQHHLDLSFGNKRSKKYRRNVDVSEQSVTFFIEKKNYCHIHI